jgi:hypothetical protein
LRYILSLYYVPDSEVLGTSFSITASGDVVLVMSCSAAVIGCLVQADFTAIPSGAFDTRTTPVS